MSTDHTKMSYRSTVVEYVQQEHDTISDIVEKKAEEQCEFEHSEFAVALAEEIIIKGRRYRLINGQYMLFPARPW